MLLANKSLFHLDLNTKVHVKLEEHQIFLYKYVNYLKNNKDKLLYK